jgi:N-acetylneuraminic acid mutarotase
MNRNIQALVSLVVVSFVLSAISIPLVSAAEDFWETMEPMPTARSGLGVAVVDGKIYAIGGYNGSYLAVNEMYDPLTNKWITKTSMPTARSGFGIAVIQNKIYVIGGVTRPSDAESSGKTGVNEVYDPSSDTWETKTSMPTPRSSLSASVSNNKIYLIGGSAYTNQSSPFYNSVSVNEVYDPETDTWTTKTRMPGSVHDYASAVVENKIYLISGVHQTAGPFYPNLLADNRIYDSETDTWTYAKRISTVVVSGAGGSTTGLLAPKRIYVIGGWNGLEIHGSNLTQIYDPEKDEWTQGTPMPTPRYGMGIAAVNDILYVIGGSTGSGILGDEVTWLATNEKYTSADYIPEFPSWIPLLFALTVIAVAIAIYKRKLHKNQSAGK